MAIKFVVCVNKEELGDLSGEDYLYPANCFEAVTLSENAEHRLHDALARMTA